MRLTNRPDAAPLFSRSCPLADFQNFSVSSVHRHGRARIPEILFMSFFHFAGAPGRFFNPSVTDNLAKKCFSGKILPQISILIRFHKLFQIFDQGKLFLPRIGILHQKPNRRCVDIFA